MTIVDPLRARVRSVLRDEWDPIGVKDVPAASDEYDEYVDAIVRKIVAGVSVDELSSYLMSIETELMGLNGDAVRARAVASRLLS